MSELLTENDWLQIEQAASGCIDGTSDDWPKLRHAIALITGKPFVHRKCAAWLQGFCEGVLAQRPTIELKKAGLQFRYRGMEPIFSDDAE